MARWRTRQLLTAAVGGPLIAVAMTTAPAGAAPPANAPAGHWGNAREIPLAGLGATTGAVVEALACASPGNCTAGGKFADHNGNVQVFVVSEVNGTWRQAGTIPGLNGTSIGSFANVRAISCPTAGNCALVGAFGDRSGAQRPFIAESKNGVWQRPVPLSFGNADIDPGEEFDATSVSCPTAGNCTAGLVVPVVPLGGGSAEQAFVVDEVNGVWGSAQPVPDTPALNDGLDAGTAAVSCFSPGNCLAGGWYTHVNERAFIATETDGSWGGAMALPGVSQLPGFGPNDAAQVKFASCTSAGNCTVSGLYFLPSGAQGFVGIETDGSWSTQAISGPTGPKLGTNTHVNAMSCNASGGCAVVGEFLDEAGSHAFELSRANDAQGFAGLTGNAEADTVGCVADRCVAAGIVVGGSFGSFATYVADETDGTWGAAHPLGGKLTVGSTGGRVFAASCAAPGNCAIGGAIEDAQGHSHAFVAVESPVTTTSVTLSRASIRFGQEQVEHVAVTVSPRAGGTPSGTVEVKAGATSLCTVTLAKGKGSCVLRPRKLRPGHYNVTATYRGDLVYSPSSSGSKALTVTR